MMGVMAGLIAVDAADAQDARGHPATPTAFAAADVAPLQHLQ